MGDIEKKKVSKMLFWAGTHSFILAFGGFMALSCDPVKMKKVIMVTLGASLFTFGLGLFLQLFCKEKE